MPLLRKCRVMAAKVEATSGTAESLSASEGVFNVFDPVINPTIELEERMGQGGFTPLTSVPGAYGATFSFTTDLTSGTSVPTWASVLLPACGFVDNASDLFSPVSAAPGSSVKTLTMALYENGRRKLMRGCAGTVVFNFPAGRRATADWTFTGVWVPDPTDTSIIAPTYPTAAPLRAAALALTIGSYTPKFEMLTIDIGNEVVLREDASHVSGYFGALITGRKVVGTLNPEAELVATTPWYADWLARTERALAFTIGDGDEQIAFAAPKLQLINVQDGDRNGMITDELEFQFNRSAAAGNDELTINFAQDA